MKSLPILWKRLVSEGKTCPRCGSTQRNLSDAVAQLEASLRPLGIQPVLETRVIDDAVFRTDPAESNRKMLGVALSDWPRAVPGAPGLDALLRALAGEGAQMARIAGGLARRSFVVPWVPRPPIGIVSLRDLVDEPA